MGNTYRSLRIKMGEHKWQEYQKLRKRINLYNSQTRNGEAVIRWRQKVKQKLIEYKGSLCSMCGYNKPIPRAYVFHHRDPSKKDFSISNSGRPVSFDRLKKEVDKCDLLCSRCHAEVHDIGDKKVRQDTLINYVNKKLKLERLKNEMLKKYNISTTKKGRDMQCLHCQKTFVAKRSGQVVCSKKCSDQKNRKCKNRPSKLDLLKLIQNKTSWVQMGKNFCVSDNAVRKWAKAYGLIE